MNYYISKSNVLSAIEYFQDSNLMPENNLFLYLLSKHLGISVSVPVDYRTSRLSREQKEQLRHELWLLGGLFDSSEQCGKYNIMFPTAFTKAEITTDKTFFNPGTVFSQMHGRVTDTLKQVINTAPVWDYDDGVIVLKYNYRELLQEKCLNGNTISLAHLAAWVLRFTAMDFPEEPTTKEFSRVVERIIRKFFKITKNDFLWLFDNDLSTNLLTPATEGITGQEIRDQFSFADDKTPEVGTAADSAEAEHSNVDRDLVERYLSMHGDNPSNGDVLNILMNKKQIVLMGVPGVGKSRYTQQLCSNPFFTATKTVQFHASYAYEDFIGAETLESDATGTHVATRKGTFLDFANEAISHPDQNYLFVIDELNRGNIAEIFGETILALDRNYTVSLSRSYEGISELHLPENLYIVGTMNTSDRNIAFLDLAIRRRFAFVQLYPNYDFLSDEVTLDGFDLGVILRTINQRIVNVLKDTELILGQSYFIPLERNGEYKWEAGDFKNQFNFVLLPTIKEYSYNDSSAISSIVGENLGDCIQEEDDFMEAFRAEFAL